jgi:hypothetical protein
MMKALAPAMLAFALLLPAAGLAQTVPAESVTTLGKDDGSTGPTLPTPGTSDQTSIDTLLPSGSGRSG